MLTQDPSKTFECPQRISLAPAAIQPRPSTWPTSARTTGHRRSVTRSRPRWSRGARPRAPHRSTCRCFDGEVRRAALTPHVERHCRRDPQGVGRATAPWPEQLVGSPRRAARAGQCGRRIIEQFRHLHRIDLDVGIEAVATVFAAHRIGTNRSTKPRHVARQRSFGGRRGVVAATARRPGCSPRPSPGCELRGRRGVLAPSLCRSRSTSRRRTPRPDRGSRSAYTRRYCADDHRGVRHGDRAATAVQHHRKRMGVRKGTTHDHQTNRCADQHRRPCAHTVGRVRERRHDFQRHLRQCATGGGG